jgi:Signal peptidase, peptidase S26
MPPLLFCLLTDIPLSFVLLLLLYCLFFEELSFILITLLHCLFYCILLLQCLCTDVQGDVMLIQKVTRSAGLHSGDMVFFTPPIALQEAVAAAGGSLRNSDLFVKRIAALPGDSVTVSPTGMYTVVTLACF